MADFSAPTATLSDVLANHSRTRPDAVAFRFLDRGNGSNQLTFAELHDRSLRLAEFIKACSGGAPVLLCMPTGPEFVVAFLGCLRAGVPAIPTCVPTSRNMAARLQYIRDDAGCHLGLTLHPRPEQLDNVPLHWVSVDAAYLPTCNAPPLPSPSELGFLQYTSGSTRGPRGVMVTQANIMHNLRMIQHSFRQSSTSHLVSWLPVFHDMGLIGILLYSIYLGCDCNLMSPATFLRSPVKWLDATSKIRGTLTGAPNFAFELCLRIPEQECGNLDLSMLQVMFSGAEPVRHATLQRFADRFAPYGLSRDVFAPCYGLAEATLAVSVHPQGSVYKTFCLSKEELRKGRVAETGAVDVGMETVSVGTICGDQTVIVVECGTGRSLPDRQIGEIWVSGDSVASGYWRKSEETIAAFCATCDDHPGRTFLRTGDLGFFDAGLLVRHGTYEGFDNCSRTKTLSSGHRVDRNSGSRRAHRLLRRVRDKQRRRR